MGDYIKVDFDELKLKIQSVHVADGGFLLVTLQRDTGTADEVSALRDALQKIVTAPTLVWRDVDMTAATRQELEDMKWRIEKLLEHKP